ncbi:MAG: hypothetical protein H3C63_13785 [Candidatus Omnitrophica bacterium]|jgi:hypothetical protein|nr:hypothetical protein [Candidatus Omnitrophota bacterium]MDX9752938.1 hypothetical protein [bacterium]
MPKIPKNKAAKIVAELIQAGPTLTESRARDLASQVQAGGLDCANEVFLEQASSLTRVDSYLSLQEKIQNQPRSGLEIQAVEKKSDMK